MLLFKFLLLKSYSLVSKLNFFTISLLCFMHYSLLLKIIREFLIKISLATRSASITYFKFYLLNLAKQYLLQINCAFIRLWSCQINFIASSLFCFSKWFKVPQIHFLISADYDAEILCYCSIKLRTVNLRMLQSKLKIICFSWLLHTYVQSCWNNFCFKIDCSNLL